MTVAIETVGSRIVVESPYNPEFPAKAKAIGGRWDGGRRAWTFDARDEARVRDLCREVYGTDGSPVDLVTVRHTVTSLESSKQTLFLYGREIVHKRGRDLAPSLGQGVIIIEGGFPTSSGSGKYPTIGGAGTIVEVRDVPDTMLIEGDEIVEEIPAAAVTVTLSGPALEALTGLRDGTRSDEEIVAAALALLAIQAAQ